jgi:hypothetical protein
MVFRDQEFEVAGIKPRMELEGKYILDELFNLRDQSGWGMFGTLMAYVVFFRICQYFLFALQTGKIRIPFLSKRRVVHSVEASSKVCPSQIGAAVPSGTVLAQKLELEAGTML